MNEQIGFYRRSLPGAGTVQATLTRELPGGRGVLVHWIDRSNKPGDSVNVSGIPYIVEAVYRETQQ